MSSKIKTYEDLQAEKQRLAQMLLLQEGLIKTDFAGVKESLKPVTKVAHTLGKTFTRDNTSPLLNFGLEMGVDIVVRRFILARAGWFLRIVIPFFVKNYTSHIIGEEQRANILKRVRNLLKKLRPEEAEPATNTATAGI
jgi:hypothetical protein